MSALRDTGHRAGNGGASRRCILLVDEGLVQSINEFWRTRVRLPHTGPGA